MPGRSSSRSASPRSSSPLRSSRATPRARSGRSSSPPTSSSASRSASPSASRSGSRAASSALAGSRPGRRAGARSTSRSSRSPASRSAGRSAWWSLASSTGHSWRPSSVPALLGTSVVIALVITALFQLFFRAKARQIQAENLATEAQLRLLQAQIEPHFLFNTLANVASLMEVDAARAKTMLEAFVDYLRASLSGLGHGRHTLGDEIDLVDAYMRIIKIRMEDRLDYSIEVPAALRALPLPALRCSRWSKRDRARPGAADRRRAGAHRRQERRPLAGRDGRRRRRRPRSERAGGDPPARRRRCARQHQEAPGADLRQRRLARHPRRRAARRQRLPLTAARASRSTMPTALIATTSRTWLPTFAKR